MSKLLYLSALDIAQIKLEPVEAIALVEKAFLSMAQNNAGSPARSIISTVENYGYQASPAYIRDESVSGVKWVSIATADIGSEYQRMHSLLILNSMTTGAPIVILDCSWIIHIRTAAATAVAAKYLANPESTSIGFIGSGEQAKSHLSTLSALFPISKAVFWTRRSTTRQEFSSHCEEHGIQPVPAEAPANVLQGQSIIVSSLPLGSNTQLDGRNLEVGSFLALVDLGSAWDRASLRNIDILAVDSRLQAEDLRRLKRNPFQQPYDFEFGELVLTNRKSRYDPTKISAAFPTGIAIGDIAIGNELLNRAKHSGLGTYVST